ncbi:MAG TPA: aminotransferase class V-fold PLP-dependent enzyme [Kofleriaceae bacterium]|nr:aminotransferase class V-fold PLP-dependent enzyme [Kofleriaceae bacterium]
MKLAEPAAPIDRWALSPDVEHINHGSYGGCPLEVIDAADTWRRQLEDAPMRFFVLDWQRELDKARDVLATFLRAPARRLAFVPNATTGVAIALATTAPSLGSGDEVLTTDHAYRACVNQLKRVAHARGAHVKTVSIPLPFDADALVEAIAAAITPRTRLALIDHITSPTAIVLPLDRIIPLFESRGITVIVDGAHAPGQLALDVEQQLDAGVTWYAGNNHKWVCGPKGTGFLAASEKAPAPTPVITSHGASPEYGPTNRFHAELDWMGTHDPSAHLAVPTAIATIAEMANGWQHVVARNHALVVEQRDRLADALGSSELCLDEDLGTMASLPITLPVGTSPLALEKQLLADGWEVPIVDFRAGPLVRISAHLYNHADQATKLAEKLHSLGVRGRKL